MLEGSEDLLQVAPLTKGIICLVGVGVFGVIYTAAKLRGFVWDWIKEWTQSDEGKSSLNSRFSEYLRSDNSELTFHKRDEDAHESMRKIMTAEVTQRFDTLERMLLDSNASQHEELENFRKDAFGQMVTLSTQVIDLLRRLMPKIND